jgi:putative ABC transport system ATP-binding protein
MLDNPTGGECYFMDEEVSKYSEKRRARLRKGNIGFVFQSFNLIDELTIFENIELPLLYLGTSTADRKKKVNALLDQLELMPRKNHFPQQISGGQQQRVAVARAIIADPKVILADEPTGNLDSSHGDEVMKMLVALNESGTTIIMVTHSPAYADYANRVIHLFDGHIVTENLKEKYKRHMRPLSEVAS